jgi:hypothetical protein
VLHGWRDATVDIDLRMEPDRDELLRAVAELKERLAINVELASPEDFIPVTGDWRERSPFIARHGPLSFSHFDLRAQALSKIERGHEQDLADVREMLARGLVDAPTLWHYFAAVSPRLHRYPALNPAVLERALEGALGARPEEPPR